MAGKEIVVRLDELFKEQLEQMNNQEGKTAEGRPALFVHKNMAINHNWSGKDIVMIGYAGMEGSSEIATLKKEQLTTYYSESFIDEAILQKKLLITLPEAATAVMSDECGLFELSEGGIFAGLWNMAQTASVGLEVELKKIPIKQETIEICNYLDLNPYTLLSGGSFLILTDNGFRLISEMKKLGIEATTIGITTQNYDRVVINDGEKRFLEKNYQDAIHQALQ